MATPTKIEVSAAIQEAVSAQGSSNELKKTWRKAMTMLGDCEEIPVGTRVSLLVFEARVAMDSQNAWLAQMCADQARKTGDPLSNISQAILDGLGL